MADVNELISLANRIKQMYTSSCRSVCKKHDLTQTEFEVIEYLSVGKGGDTAADISKHRQIQKANISTAVDRLIKKELLTRLPDLKDRRVVHLKLTENAAKAAAEIRRASDEFNRVLSLYLSENELKSFIEAAEKLKESELAYRKSKARVKRTV